MDILELIDQGNQTVADLGESYYLRQAAESFLSVYASFEDGFGVVAASPQAERVLGAAMMLNPGLCMSKTGSTVIFDVNIASGTLISRAARRLRDGGNHCQLVAVALHSLVEHDHEWVVPELSSVIVADCFKEELTRRQEAESGDHRIVLAG